MKSEAELLCSFLAGRDVPCPTCEYNLRDLAGDRCPECGDQLVLKVNPVEPRQAAAITGLVILAAGAGLNGLLLIYLLVMVLTGPGLGSFWQAFFYVNGAGFLVEGSAVCIWLSQWKKIRLLPPIKRWVLSVCFCGFLTIADLVVFTKYIQ